MALCDAGSDDVGLSVGAHVLLELAVDALEGIPSKTPDR